MSDDCPSEVIHVVGAAILDGPRCLVARRGPDMSLPGFWEFPGGKVDSGEAPRAALARELREELDVEASIGDWLGRGEALHRDVRIVLDVHQARLESGRMNAREHSELKWVDADELDGLDWAEADIPILPAVRARLSAAAETQRATGVDSILAVDWGKRAGKRAAYLASRSESGWSVARLPPPPGGWGLAGLVDVAERQRDQRGGGVLIGIDAAIGVPAAFLHEQSERGFLDWLERAATAGLLDESETDASPFFHIPKGRGALTSLIHAAGGRSHVFRQVEIRTRAKTVFALSGIPGTVGSGARALWQELAPLVAQQPRRVDVWPFHGDLQALSGTPRPIVGEVYPRAAYAVALAPSLPTTAISIAKTKQAARERALAELEQASWRASHSIQISDLDAAAHSEDDFDAMITAVALARLASEGRPLSWEWIDVRAEGGILGTGGLQPQSAPRLTARQITR